MGSLEQGGPSESLRGAQWGWLGLSLLLLVSGCDPGSEVQQLDRELRDVSVEFDHSRHQVDTLQGTLLVTDDALGLPITMTVVGGFVVVGDGTLSPPIHIFRVGDGSSVATIGSRGEGPGEFSSVPRLVRVPWQDGTILWAFDPALARITGIPLEGAMVPERDVWEMRRMSLEFPIVDVGFLSDDTFVGWGLHPMARLVRIDPDGKVIEGIGEVPAPDGLRELNAGLRQRAYQPFLSVAPDGARIAVASWKASRIDFVDLESPQENVSTEGPFPFLPSVEVDETLRANRLVRGARNRTGHVGVVATGAAVLTLFSGRLERTFRDQMDEAEYLHVYRWDGSFVRAFRLDRPARAMACVEPTCHTVLTLVWTPTPAVVRYELPEGWDAFN